MAEKAKKQDNKNLIIGICAAVAVVIVIVLAVVFGNQSPALDDAYFVSDGTKYVLTMEADSEDLESEFSPVKTHVVYFYSGDKITDAKSYYEFASAEQAKAAFDAFKAAGEDLTGVSLNGKYIVLTADKSEYENLTASEVKQQIELMESLQNLNLDDDSSDGE